MLKLVFMGSAELACGSLAALAESGQYEIMGVVTQPDRPRGRKLQLQPSPVKELALRLNLPILQPERARAPEFLEQLAELTPDLIVVAAYGQILPAAILELPRFGCLNLHTSLLPKYRGASPIQAAIFNDDAETGVTIMKMDEGLDTGDIVAMKITAIAPEDDSQTLHDRLAKLGGESLLRVIPDYTEGRIVPRPQPEEGVSHVGKIFKSDGLIDWTRPARGIWCQVRAYTPWPGAFVRPGEGAARKILKFWKTEVDEDLSGRPGEILAADKEGVVVACGKGALRILTLQPEGGRRMTASEFLTGHRLNVGELISQSSTK